MSFMHGWSFAASRGVLPFVLILAGACPAWPATIIEYEAIDLPNTVPSQDRWEYRYFVGGFNFSASEGFTIWFPQSLAAQLESPVPPNSEWDVLVLQPDPAIPARGAFDTLALVGNASVAQPFVVDFVSLTVPLGPQEFDLNLFDDQGNFVRVIESGITVPRQTATVPEPSPSWLLLLAGLGLTLMKRASVSRRRCAPHLTRVNHPDLAKEG
jgi:hypothetical protein